MNLQEFKSSDYGNRIKSILIRTWEPKTKRDYELIDLGMNNTHRQLTYNGYFKRNNPQELESYIKAIDY